MRAKGAVVAGGSGRRWASRYHARGEAGGAGVTLVRLAGTRFRNRWYRPHRVMRSTAGGEGGTETASALADAARSVRIGELLISVLVPKEHLLGEGGGRLVTCVSCYGQFFRWPCKTCASP